MARLPFVVALGVLLTCATSPALAQAPRPERPYRGLFGSGVGDAEQSLMASGSFGVGWDDDLQAAFRDSGSVSSTGSSPLSGSLGTVSAALSYSYRPESFQLLASAGTSGQYFPSVNDEFVRSTQAAVSLSKLLASQTSFAVAGSVSHAPYSFLSLFPTPAIDDLGSETPATSDLIDPNAAISPDSRISYAGTSSVSQRLSTRTTLAAAYRYQGTERPEDTTGFHHHNGSLRLTHNLSAGLGVHAGYGYGRAQTGNGEPNEHHSIDAGINYNRALSLTRRTTVSFSTGSSAARTSDSLRVFIVGSANLTHEIGRSWSTWIAYGRQLRYHETWREPGLGNSVSFGLNGLITRQLQFSSTGRVAFGKVGLDSDAPGFDQYYATALLSYAVSRFMSLSLSYGYYEHRFDEGAPLAEGVPRTLDRNSVRLAVNLWTPIFQRSRRPDAAR